MTLKQAVVIGIGSLAAVALALEVIPMDRVEGLYDGLWWRVLPWVLLVVLWAGIGVWAYRKRFRR